MDAFDDGKFPLGTQCNLSSDKNAKAYCVGGKCVAFDDKDIISDEGDLI